MTTGQNWHGLKTAEVLRHLGSRHEGLTTAEAGERAGRYGPNILERAKKASAWKLFLEQFKSFLVIILLIAVVLSAFLGETTDAVIIGIIVIFASLLGFFQEFRAERAMEALQQMAAPLATVLRDGHELELPARELVPGDIIVIRTGDRIPADARLVEAANLRTDEASLTGESVPVEKTADTVEPEASLADRRNMLYAGTTAVYGRGIAVVTDTGMSTEFGKIAGLLQEVKTERTPLQVNLDRTGKWIAIAALVLVACLATLGVLRGHGIMEMFLWGIALAVAAVPEALPAVVAISLALGVRRMVKRHALIRRLPAVETLGCTTFICSDKTGTLTQDKMTIQQVYADSRLLEVTGNGYAPEGVFRLDGADVFVEKESALYRLLLTGLLCNDTSLVRENGSWTVNGDPTEGSLLVAAAKGGLEPESIRESFPRVDEIPFSSERKRMTTVNRSVEGDIACSKGSFEAILDSCCCIYIDGQEKELSDSERDNIRDVAGGLADRALRVLGLSYKSLGDGNGTDSPVEQDMVFLGLVGMMDPPREEVKAAIDVCEKAGVKTVMITGDNKTTAVAIARELGLFKGGLALTGAELDNMTTAELDRQVENIEVYARVSPTHKLRVVEALTAKGHVVAMTGDGVNDAPALKKADIGIAMGISGTDVTREAADMILTDDNFASIVAAVEEGRGIFGNIKKYLMYLLSSNVGEILLMAGAILLGPVIGLPSGTIPLVAVQILWVNLATDGLPAIALSVDPPDADVMSRKPRPRGQGIFTKPVVALMLVGGIWTFLVNLGVFTWALDSGRSLLEAQALCFLTLVIIQLFNAYNFRSDRYSIFSIGLFRNRWLNLAVVWETMLLVIIVYVPFLQGAFNTFALGLKDWLLVILLAASICPVLEIAKVVVRWRTGTQEVPG